MSGTPSAPKLPGNNKKTSKKKTVAPSSKTLPIFEAQMITLEDGTQVPIKIPPHMGPEQAKALVEMLRSNPAAAQAVYQQAQSIMANPALASALVNMPIGGTAPPSEAALAHFEVLKDDPDMQAVMADVAANGPAALQKYWDDKDLMSKISQKLKAANLGPQEAIDADNAANNGAGASAPPPPPKDLHEAAKRGDVAAARRMIEDEGADVNAKNDRAVTPLGIAVGFNKVDVVRLLLDKGADVKARDAMGNTVLHYAAGYGRREVAELLLAAGVELTATNNNKLTAADAAKLNKETGMVKFLSEYQAPAAQVEPTASA